MSYRKHSRGVVVGLGFIEGMSVHVQWPDGVIELARVILQPGPSGLTIPGFSTSVHGLRCFVSLDEVAIWGPDLPAKSNVTVLKHVRRSPDGALLERPVWGVGGDDDER